MVTERATTAVAAKARAWAPPSQYCWKAALPFASLEVKVLVDESHVPPPGVASAACEAG